MSNRSIASLRGVTKLVLAFSIISLAAVLPAKAVPQLIYVVLGVVDSGDINFAGHATAIHCSNLTLGAVNVTLRAHRFDGAVVKVQTESLPAGTNKTFVTHAFTTLGNDFVFATGALFQGRIHVLTDLPSAIVCAADWLDAAHNPPTFVAPRRMIRYPRPANGGED